MLYDNNNIKKEDPVIIIIIIIIIIAIGDGIGIFNRFSTLTMCTFFILALDKFSMSLDIILICLYFMPSCFFLTRNCAVSVNGLMFLYYALQP